MRACVCACVRACVYPWLILDLMREVSPLRVSLSHDAACVSLSHTHTTPLVCVCLSLSHARRRLRVYDAACLSKTHTSPPVCVFLSHDTATQATRELVLTTPIHEQAHGPATFRSWLQGFADVYL